MYQKEKWTYYVTVTFAVTNVFRETHASNAISQYITNAFLHYLLKF